MPSTVNGLAILSGDVAWAAACRRMLLLLVNILPKIQNLGLKLLYFGGSVGAKLKFEHHICLVGNFQLSVG